MAAPTRRDLTMVVPAYHERNRLDELVAQVFETLHAHAWSASSARPAHVIVHETEQASPAPGRIPA